MTSAKRGFAQKRKPQHIQQNITSRTTTTSKRTFERRPKRNDDMTRPQPDYFQPSPLKPVGWRLKAMPNLDAEAEHLDTEFQKSVRSHYRNISLSNRQMDDEYLMSPNPSIGHFPTILRLSVMKEPPDASRLAHVASSAALGTYKNHVLMLLGDLKKRKSVYTTAGLPIPACLESLDGEIKKYQAIQQVYSAALRTFYPMYAAHHMDPVERKDDKMGYFHCPCGPAGVVWRTRKCRPEEGWPHYSRQDFPGEFDLVPDCEKKFEDMVDLVNHMEACPGPLHRAAATYLRSLYFRRKEAIKIGTRLHNVDKGTVEIKQEGRENDFFVKIEEYIEPAEEGVGGQVHGGEQTTGNNSEVEVVEVEESDEKGSDNDDDESDDDEDDRKPPAKKKTKVCEER